MTRIENNLEIKGLTIALGKKRLIEQLNLHIAAGETVALMGASGSGKSTLLAWLCGVLDPAFNATGELYVKQQRIEHLPCEQRQVGLLFQDTLLFPHLSVGENLMFGVPANVKKSERRTRAEQALAEAGLADYFSHHPATLSGGQAARVSLMRTLLSEPQALLLDEPYSRLDQTLRAQFRAFVLEHTAAKQLPTLIVTHDPEDVPPGSRCLSMTDFRGSALT